MAPLAATPTTRITAVTPAAPAAPVLKSPGVVGTSFRRTAYVNNFGYYIIPDLPVNTTQPIQLRASIEELVASLSFPVGGLSPGQTYERNITLANSRPKFNSLVMDTPDGRHWTADAGTEVQVTANAQDPDGDPVHYRWILPDGSGKLSDSCGHQVSWQLPAERGKFGISVLAYDKKGGYAKERITISTADGVTFSGFVDATNSPAVDGAEVEINGITTKTNALRHQPDGTGERGR